MVLVARRHEIGKERAVAEGVTLVRGGIEGGIEEDLVIDVDDVVENPIVVEITRREVEDEEEPYQ
jgi:hypothetical protein